MKSLMAFGGILAMAATAQAHFYFIEPAEGGRAKVYHVDYQEGFRAEKIKKWENYKTLKAWTADANGKAVAVELKQEDGHFSVPFAAGTRGVWTSNTERGVADWRKYGEGISRPFSYCRWLPSLAAAPAEPLMDLEALPVKGKPGAFKVWFKGKPVEGAKVNVYAPNFWNMEKYSDKDGLIQVPTPWAGTYVVAVHHFEATPQGIWEGAPYEFERHTSSLCVEIKP